MPSETGSITPMFLSGSTNGRQINVSATISSGATVLHTAIAGTNSMDFITLVANNHSGANVVLTIEYGGTTDPDDLMVFDLAKQESQKILLLGARLNNGLVVSAFAASANAITIYGHVNRIRL